MSSRFFQLQTEAAHGSQNRSSSPNKHSHSHSHSHSHRPQPQTTSKYSQRTSTSSDSSSSSSSSSYSTSSYNYSADNAQRYSMDASQPRVEVLRCSRCAKCVETVTHSRSGDDSRRVSTDDASASGMVRFGHNLYYCDRCARLVGYK
jgi:hypothetical protein